MANGQMSEVIQYLRRAVLLRDGAGLTDGQLLTDYLSHRDEAALAALVRRHGPMVWGVCRRVLRNYSLGGREIPKTPSSAARLLAVPRVLILGVPWDPLWSHPFVARSSVA